MHDGRNQAGIRLSVPALLAKPLLLRQLAVLAALEAVSGSNPGSERVAAVMGLLENEPGATVTLAGGTEVIRNRDGDPSSGPSGERTVFPSRSTRDGSTRWRGSGFPPVSSRRGDRMREEKRSTRTRRGRGRWGLTLRSWREGDSFVPLGMAGRKKISDFFVDQQVPLQEKHRIPLLLTRDGEVIWVCGMRLDDRFKITPATRRVLKLEYVPLSDR